LFASADSLKLLKHSEKSYSLQGLSKNRIVEQFPTTSCVRSLSRGSVERVAAAAIRRYFLATGFEATAWSVFFVADIASRALYYSKYFWYSYIGLILTVPWKRPRGSAGIPYNMYEERFDQVCRRVIYNAGI